MMRFIRHGQSAFNVHFDRDGSDPGIADAPLTPHGFHQARKAAEKLAGQGVAMIVSSPYTRALQTASTIAEVLGIGIVAEPMARERRLFSCDIGTPTRVLRAAWPQVDFSAVQHEHWWRFPAPADENALPERGPAEEQHEVHRRCDAFMAKWRPQAATRPLLVVSHWYFIHAATGKDVANAEIVAHAARA